MNSPKSFSSLAFILLALCLTPFAQAQAAEDDSNKSFHDDLLDHFVGKWEVSAVVHGEKFMLDREAEWVFNHQYLRMHEKTREVVPWLGIPFERTVFIGYNHRLKHYVIYELTVHGADVPHEPEGLYYADRTGNELTFELRKGVEVIGKGRWTWDPASSTWHIRGSRMKDGKEVLFLHHIAVAVRPSP